MSQTETPRFHFYIVFILYVQTYVSTYVYILFYKGTTSKQIYLIQIKNIITVDFIGIHSQTF